MTDDTSTDGAMSEVYRWYGKDDKECYVFEVDGTLYHSHDNKNGWSTRKLTLPTLEHHAIMHHGMQKVRDVPNGLQQEINHCVQTGTDQ